MQSQEYYEKLELVYQEYERSLDLDIAFAIVPLKPAEREKLSKDPDLAARISVCDARRKAEMIETLVALSRDAENEGVQLSALKELGKTFYPKRFKEADVNLNLLYRIIPRAKQDLEAEAS